MAFLGNSVGGKHLGCIISRVAPYMKVLGEKYDQARRSPKIVKIEGCISHDFRRLGCLEGTLDGILRTSLTLNGHKNFYDRFGSIAYHFGPIAHLTSFFFFFLHLGPTVHFSSHLKHKPLSSLYCNSSLSLLISSTG